MYTCLFTASVEGGSCFEPLLFHYPENDEVFDSGKTESSFIVGDALKVTPVLEPNVTTVKSFFPAGSWVNMRDYSVITTDD